MRFLEVPGVTVAIVAGRRPHGAQGVTVAIMAGSPFPRQVAVFRRVPGESPSPSLPVSLSQGGHRRHHGRLPFAHRT